MKLLKYKNIRMPILIILALILTPMVFNIIKDARRSNVYAIDPLIVTYNGSSPPSPVFYVTNMLPGDEVTKEFNVKNGSTEDEQVTMDAIMTAELKDFSHILEVEVTDLSDNSSVYSGTLDSLLSLPPISLGNFLSDADKDFRVRVKFPESAGNEYQKALVVFDIIWRTDGPVLELPEECKLLEGKIVNVIEGTEGDDRIRGTDESDLIFGYGGNDDIDGERGDDCIIGGDGDDDELDGSYGNDIIVGGPGDDEIDGSDGNDILYGGDGNDKIDGSDNDDIIFGGAGNDEIDGGGNKDAIFAGDGDDEIDGGQGDDSIYGEDGNDTIEGSSGKDIIYGGLGHDVINGGTDDDQLYGNEGNDDINGSTGDDYIDGGSGNNTINGSTGQDECINGPTIESCEF